MPEPATDNPGKRPRPKKKSGRRWGDLGDWIGEWLPGPSDPVPQPRPIPIPVERYPRRGER